MEHGEELVATQERAFSHDLAESTRSRTPQQPTYDEHKMLARLLREGLFHRDSERRHLTALLISASPFGEAVTEEMLLLLGRTDLPGWVRVRAATLVRYLSNNTHRMRMLHFLDDPDPDVATRIGQALGHLTSTEFSGRRDQQRLHRRRCRSVGY